MAYPAALFLRLRKERDERLRKERDELELVPIRDEHIIKPNTGQWKVVDPEYANYVPTYKNKKMIGYKI